MLMMLMFLEMLEIVVTVHLWITVQSWGWGVPWVVMVHAISLLSIVICWWPEKVHIVVECHLRGHLLREMVWIGKVVYALHV